MTIFGLGLYVAACLVGLWMSMASKYVPGIVSTGGVLTANVGSLVLGLSLPVRVAASPVVVGVLVWAIRRAFSISDLERDNRDRADRFNKVAFALVGIAVLETALALIGGAAYLYTSSSPF